MDDDVTQAMSKGGGCLWMSKSRGVFQILGRWMTSRGECPRGGGACGYLCKISGKSTPLPPPNQSVPIRLFMPVPTCGFTQRLPWRFDFCGHNANQIRIIWTRAHLDVLEHPPVRFGRIWSSSFEEKGLRGQPDTHTHTYIHTDRLVTVMTSPA